MGTRTPETVVDVSASTSEMVFTDIDGCIKMWRVSTFSRILEKHSRNFQKLKWGYLTNIW